MSIEGIAAAGGTTTGGTARSSAKLAENFDTFLNLLTAQLKNQDPLEPMDANQFTQQLVQFSGVEQAIQTNKKLDTLADLVRGQSGGTAVGYLGREVTARSADARLEDGQASWHYRLDGSAAKVALLVQDGAGKIVAALPGESGAGTHDAVWDGTDANGRKLPEGIYTLSVAAQNEDGQEIGTAVTLDGRVSGVEMAADGPSLVVGGVAVRLEDVLAIHEPASGESDARFLGLF